MIRFVLMLGCFLIGACAGPLLIERSPIQEEEPPAITGQFRELVPYCDGDGTEIGIIDGWHKPGHHEFGDEHEMVLFLTKKIPGSTKRELICQLDGEVTVLILNKERLEAAFTMKEAVHGARVD